MARRGDLAQQKAVWRESFGDPWKYIRFYFKNRYRPEETLLLTENGEIAAMLTLMPMTLAGPGFAVCPTLYLYGYGAGDRWRGSGLGTKLLHAAEEAAAARGADNIILVPANPRLHGYFAVQGYEELFALRELEWDEDAPVEGKPPGSIRPAEAEQYREIRDKLLAGRFSALCGETDLYYQKLLSRQTGADLYLIRLGAVIGCAAAEYGPDGCVLVKELLLPDGLLADGMNLLRRELSAARYRVRLPADSGETLGGELRPYAMIWRRNREDPKWAGPFQTGGYMGFGFD